MMPYQLIQQHISSDTVEACEQLLANAKSGQIIGLGVLVMLKKRRYLVDTTGEVSRDPVWARGALMSLDDCLRDQVQGRKDSATTI